MVNAEQARKHVALAILLRVALKISTLLTEILKTDPNDLYLVLCHSAPYKVLRSGPMSRATGVASFMAEAVS
jgi:hypothetical protein